MKADIKTLTGESKGQVDLDPAVFGAEEIRGDIIQRVITWQLAKRRAGTHSTQSRSEVSVTTKKFIRQKGSGGARHGSRNAPIFVGGGIAHGPRPRSYAYSLPKKIRRMGLRHALSAKAKDGKLLILDDISVETAKTAPLAKAFADLGIGRALVIPGTAVDDTLARAAGNIREVDVLPVMGLNVYDIMRRDMLVIAEGALPAISDRLAGKTAQADPFSADNFVDDVQLVDGIGPRAARIMRQAGIGTLTAFAEMADDARAELLTGMGKLAAAEREDWLGQAKEMMAGGAPRARIDRQNAARQLKKRAVEAR